MPYALQPGVRYVHAPVNVRLPCGYVTKVMSIHVFAIVGRHNSHTLSTIIAPIISHTIPLCYLSRFYTELDCR
jgi:hypothetical protein